MGHRANFVVIQDSSARAFHDQWAALGCVFALADGANVATEEAQKLTPTDELLEWCWAEGGYLIDYDRHLVIAFGMLESELDFEGDDEDDGEENDGDGEESGEDDKSAKAKAAKEAEGEARQFLLKIAPKWKGWLLRWDQRGVDAFAAHLKERGIKNIRTQRKSHPKDCLLLEHQA